MSTRKRHHRKHLTAGQRRSIAALKRYNRARHGGGAPRRRRRHHGRARARRRHHTMPYEPRRRRRHHRRALPRVHVHKASTRGWMERAEAMNDGAVAKRLYADIPADWHPYAIGLWMRGERTGRGDWKEWALAIQGAYYADKWGITDGRAAAMKSGTPLFFQKTERHTGHTLKEEGFGKPKSFFEQLEEGMKSGFQSIGGFSPAGLPNFGGMKGLDLNTLLQLANGGGRNQSGPFASPAPAPGGADPDLVRQAMEEAEPFSALLPP